MKFGEINLSKVTYLAEDEANIGTQAISEVSLIYSHDEVFATSDINATLLSAPLTSFEVCFYLNLAN